MRKNDATDRLPPLYVAPIQLVPPPLVPGSRPVPASLVRVAIRTLLAVRETEIPFPPSVLSALREHAESGCPTASVVLDLLSRNDIVPFEKPTAEHTPEVTR